MRTITIEIDDDDLDIIKTALSRYRRQLEQEGDTKDANRADALRADIATAFRLAQNARVLTRGK